MGCIWTTITRLQLIFSLLFFGFFHRYFARIFMVALLQRHGFRIIYFCFKSISFFSLSAEIYHPVLSLPRQFFSNFFFGPMLFWKTTQDSRSLACYSSSSTILSIGGQCRQLMPAVYSIEWRMRESRAASQLLDHPLAGELSSVSYVRLLLDKIGYSSSGARASNEKPAAGISVDLNYRYWS